MAGGSVELSDRVLMTGNVAPTGSSIRHASGSLTYTLPAPPGRWVAIDDGGTTSTVQPGSNIMIDYPQECVAGYYGDTEADATSAFCSGACVSHPQNRTWGPLSLTPRANNFPSRWEKP